MNKQKAKKPSMLRYIMQEKKLISFAVIFLLISVFLGRGVTFLNTYLVDNVIKNSNIGLLIGISSTIFGFLMIEAILLFFQNKIFCDVGYRVAGKIRRDLYDKIIYAPLIFFEENPVANVLSKTTTYVNDLGNFAIKNLVPFIFNLMKFLSVFVFMIAINWKLGLIIIGILALLLLLVCLLDSVTKRLNKKFKMHEIKRDEIIVDNVFGHETILANGGKESQEKKFDDENIELNKSWWRFSLANELYLPLLEAVWFLGIIIVYIFGFKNSSGLEIGGVITFISFIMQANEPIKQTALNFQAFINIRGTINKIFDLFSIDTRRLEERTKSFNSDKPEIIISNTSFDGGEKGKIVSLSNFTIGFGEKVLFYGKGGSGKTTLANLFSRLYHPTKGKILLNKTDIQKIKNEDFRKVVGVFSGETFLFNNTLLENVRLANLNASDEDVENAIRKAGLSEKLDSLPRGMDTVMTKNGQMFSESERQLVGFARLILQNPKIVIIDEAVDRLNSTTQKDFYKTLHEFTKDKTCLLFSEFRPKNYHPTKTYKLIDGEIIKKRK